MCSIRKILSVTSLILLFFVTNAESSNTLQTYKGSIADRCIVNPQVTAVTFAAQSVGPSNDGFYDKLSAESANNSLRFFTKCNGAVAIISFRRPVRTNTNGPSLNPNARYYTKVDYGDGFTATIGADPVEVGMFTKPSGRILTFSFSINNFTPLPAGNYDFKLEISISANM